MKLTKEQKAELQKRGMGALDGLVFMPNDEVIKQPWNGVAHEMPSRFDRKRGPDPETRIRRKP
jgi:hypothetical protein